eukprot:TRINITY_DN28623_c0_g1_i1.p1 TRINITY_DN28623_c0_g1~~TRINITY_DN28623_c0_g1_i1.p1  ORF type:complete len:509 (+),score=131.88 TRINITY_DN28623_c0_g1_i1:38-1564(+)
MEIHDHNIPDAKNVEILLAFYRENYEKLPQLTKDCINKLGELEVSVKAFHDAQQNIKYKEEEISELQKGLSDATVFLMEAKKENLHLKAENDEQKLKELELRRQIRHLLQLNNPTTQQVIFERDTEPKQMTRFPTSETVIRSEKNTTRTTNTNNAYAKRIQPQAIRSHQIHSHKRRNHAITSTATGTLRSTHDASKQSRILRIVNLPSEQADELMLRIQSLEAQLAETKKFSEERDRALIEDRRVRFEEYKLKIESYKKQITSLEEELSKTQGKFMGLTKDHLTHRHNNKVELQQIVEQNSQLIHQHQLLKENLSETKRRSAMELEEVRRATKLESEAFIHQFRVEAQAKEEDASILKEQRQEMQSHYEKKIRGLQAENKDWKQKYRNLERRRNLELEGYTRDIAALQKQTRMLESCSFFDAPMNTTNMTKRSKKSLKSKRKSRNSTFNSTSNRTNITNSTKALDYEKEKVTTRLRQLFESMIIQQQQSGLLDSPDSVSHELRNLEMS